MIRVRAQFAKPTCPSKRLWHLALFSFALAGALSGWSWFERQRLADERHVAAKALSESRAPIALRSDPPAPPPYDESARRMLRERQAAWPQALIALEGAGAPEVTPVSFESLPNEKSLQLELEFTNHKALLGFIDALNGENTSDASHGWHWVLLNSRQGTQGVGSALLVARQSQFRTN